jgi:hypothetical protein
MSPLLEQNAFIEYSELLIHAILTCDATFKRVKERLHILSPYLLIYLPFIQWLITDFDMLMIHFVFDKEWFSNGQNQVTSLNDLVY